MKVIGNKGQYILKNNNSKIIESLLSPDEISPYITLNPNSNVPVVLVCDHAGNRFPRSLGTMGLDYLDRISHIAIDIGAGNTTESLAKKLNATAVLCQYSRLIVDCNRKLTDNTAFIENSDGIDIPGNQNLKNNTKKVRASEIYWPYHDAIDTQISRLKDQGISPIIISIHSFTPTLEGHEREWEIVVLWDKDHITANFFLANLKDAGFLVGDNKPYSGKHPEDFTIDYHAEAVGLPHVGLEIRQDIINHDEGVEHISNILQEIVKSLTATTKPSNIQTNKSLR